MLWSIKPIAFTNCPLGRLCNRLDWCACGAAITVFFVTIDTSKHLHILSRYQELATPRNDANSKTLCLRPSSRRGVTWLSGTVLRLSQSRHQAILWSAFRLQGHSSLNKNTSAAFVCFINFNICQLAFFSHRFLTLPPKQFEGVTTVRASELSFKKCHSSRSPSELYMPSISWRYFESPQWVLVIGYYHMKHTIDLQIIH